MVLEHNACLQTERSNPYTGVPKQIIHAKGWDVPSWALTPVARVLNPNLLVRQSYPMPAYKDLVEQAHIHILLGDPPPMQRRRNKRRFEKKI